MSIQQNYNRFFVLCAVALANGNHICWSSSDETHHQPCIKRSSQLLQCCFLSHCWTLNFKYRKTALLNFAKSDLKHFDERNIDEMLVSAFILFYIVCLFCLVALL